jgi:rhodanese-related sulfurtransferase
VSAAEAAGLMRWPRGFVLVDVRRSDQFALYHAKGSRNAALYRLIDIRSGSPMQLLRALAFNAQNVDAVEEAPDFLETLRAATAGASGVIFADAEGGSLEATPQRPYGQVCRALIAACALCDSGYKGEVTHLVGGTDALCAQQTLR